MALEVLAVLRRSARTFSRPLITSYSVLKFRFTSTASFLGGRSRTWPMEAFTRKSLPRYLLIVFALAGDSTITSDFSRAAIGPLSLIYVHRAGQRGPVRPPRPRRSASPSPRVGPVVRREVARPRGGGRLASAAGP